ncbi:Nramp family divalent metal transporter [Solidesulfovibrio sp.]|uniref:Nramp family divalent metal transporter n=1 Tax=Solidesulfovibrio sp. TaxID=2910990 RepID=UPI002617DA56|nr:Nramp family divalent metal transporter [Solidesulfovibrio sp.]
MEPFTRLARAVGDMVRFRDHARPRLTALEIFKYVGPGLLVTVGFIDPGNWASNVAAGSDFGYKLLWMVTLSTVMLIVLQHNAAHLGIATGLCLSEAAVKHLPRPVSAAALSTAVAAAVSTALAELLGGAIALRMLFGLPLPVGTFLVLALVLWMLFSNSYRKLEKYIIGFVSLIGLSFIFELSLVHVDWGQAVAGWVTPRLPDGALPVVMSVLGAVVMPHNLFLHSEVIQSRQWNLDKPEMIRRQLKYEYLDTLFSMLVGFCINSAMILLAAAAFFVNGTSVSELDQAKELLTPLVGPAAGLVFAVSLLLAGVASSVTAGMAGGSIFAGMFGEPYDIRDSHSRLGVVITLVGAAVAILFVGDPLKGLIWSQIALSIQLPITILLQIGLTSRRTVMGPYVNRPFTTGVLAVVALVVITLNVMLLVETLGG